jgi:uncharacterized membrane protein
LKVAKFVVHDTTGAFYTTQRLLLLLRKDLHSPRSSVVTTVAAATQERPTTTARRARYWEIDALRGVAIVMMVIFHLMWDFVTYDILPNVVLYAGFWKYFQRTCANLFLTLVGVSLAVVTIQRMGDDLRSLPPFRPYLLRGLKIFGCGLLVTLVVWAARIGYVHFGVLHLIGFASIAAYPLLRQRGINLLLWAIFFLGGYFLLTQRFDFPWLLWLGLIPGPGNSYRPVDYFPVIPYFGVVLLGIFLGNSLYGPGGRRFLLPDIGQWLPIRALRWLGRHSLIIYLTHQLALFAILVALGLIRL